ncbi:hypothetical protein RJ640_022811 [Escallonia rubra]|uniref:Uncharacterized protein n=1 Tax=Escallonia rubra TaxID=112253 RepID=A0AA88RM20_9ASTE|nr:hypothetical protein RJ640_022811 [Escallonia rubra]
MAALKLFISPLPSSFSTTTTAAAASFSFQQHYNPLGFSGRTSRRRSNGGQVFVGKEETELLNTSTIQDDQQDFEQDPDPQDLEYVAQIKRVLELLKKNRDMLFSEVKLTIMIEDPRDVERRRLLGIDEVDGPTRDDLADVLEERRNLFPPALAPTMARARHATNSLVLVPFLSGPLRLKAQALLDIDVQMGTVPYMASTSECICTEVNEGKIPKDRVALQMLAEEMAQWPNLEVEVKKKGPRKSLYAKATDTGVDPQVAAKRLNMDWDSAAEIQDSDVNDDSEVPAVLGYGALYLVTAFPVIIDVLPFTDTPRADETYIKHTDSFMSVENLEDPKFFLLEKPTMLIKERRQKERQISVDPISMKESENPSKALTPIITARNVRGTSLPLPLLPAKPKFLSSSLPNSASSSPQYGSATKKWKNQDPESPFSMVSLSSQHSVALSRLAQLRESHLQRSKSCREGRACAPSDNIDLWLTKVNSNRHGSKHFNSSSDENEPKTESGMVVRKRDKEMADSYDEKVKCGALCLFLPGFGKGKPVRARKEEVEMSHVMFQNQMSQVMYQREISHIISKRASLEKFECGSWTSSAIMNDSEEDGNQSNRYFDLPLELIRSSVNDADSPVRAAFVFDKDRKGVLKNGLSRGRSSKSHESSRHVRFSTSSPTSDRASPSPCITPRLRKAREDFNAFLEAQSV